MKKEQKGLGTVILIAIVVVVGIIGAVGWFIFNNNETPKPVSPATSSEVKNTSQKTAEETKETASQTEYLDIEQWGVRFALNDKLKGLYYNLGNNNRTAYFSLEEFKDTSCAAELTAQVALSRYTDQDFAEDDLAATAKDSAKKIGEYYFWSQGGQSGCSEDTKVQEKASALRSEIISLLPATLEQIQ